MRVPHVLLAALLSLNLACGTLLYPERRGVEDPDHIDPAVVLMDGALLLFFVVPGVVAFAVDIATGAIYEPEEEAMARRIPREPLRVAAADAETIEVEGASAHSDNLPERIWWEGPDGERTASRLSATASGRRYRLESRGPLEPGEYRLHLTDREAGPVVAITIF